MNLHPVVEGRFVLLIVGGFRPGGEEPHESPDDVDRGARIVDRR
jgi:hypothetical protein